MKPTSKAQTGSRSQVNPLQRLKWLFRPNPSPKTLINLEPIRKYAPSDSPTRLKLVDVPKAMKGEITDERYGVLKLYFDVGIRNEIEGIAQTLRDRRHQDVTTPMKMGWGGQLAFSYYLNFFSQYALFTVEEDRPQASQKPKPYDFRIGHFSTKPPEKFLFTIEIKTSPFLSRNLNYYQPFNQKYSRYAVIIRCLNEEMTRYELFGYTLGSKVKAHKHTIVYGKKRHSMALTRTNFDYYTYFHHNILFLPFKEKFGD